MVEQKGFRLVLFSFCFLFFSCSKKGQVKVELEILQSQAITVCLDSMECVQRGQNIDSKIVEQAFKWVVYADSSVCSSCKLSEMYKWDDLLRKVEKYRDRLKFYFIFSPSSENRRAFDWTVRTYAPEYPIYIDTLGIFERSNSHLPHNPIFHTFLLDENNNVLLVGNPLENKKIEEMFWQIVEEKLGKQE